MLKCSKCNNELIIKDKVLINNNEDIEIIYGCKSIECDFVRIVSSKDYI